jgi:Fic family protein
MYDPKKPYNDLPLLPPAFNFDNVAILKQVNLANMALMKLNVKASRLPDATLLMSPLLVRESMASSAIENIHTTMEDVIHAELLPEEKRSGPAKEVLHYRNAMEHGLSLVREKGMLTTNDFVAIQGVVESSKPGIRKTPVTIRSGSTAEVLYTPPVGEKELRDLLHNLERYMNDKNDETDPLIKMAVMHHQFEAIHPFLDGNGRVGRILMVLYLVLAGRLDHPILFLSGWVQQQKSAYYRLLRETTETRNYGPLILYFLEAVTKQANDGAITVQKIEELMQEYEKKIDKELKTNAHKLTQVLFSRPLLTIDYIQEQMELSARQTASKYLTTLADSGLLKLQTSGLQKIYYIPQFLEVLT